MAKTDLVTGGYAGLLAFILSHQYVAEFPRGYGTLGDVTTPTAEERCARGFSLVKCFSVLIFHVENIDSYKPHKCKFFGVLNALRV